MELDRKLYTEVDKVLRAMGGKWDRRSRSHVFKEEDPEEAMDRALTTGAVVSRKAELGAFYTPPELADDVIARADLRSGMTVLEPSAGRGALAAPALLAGCIVTCVEIDKRSVDVLCSTAFKGVVHGDFLAQSALPAFDRVVMNPPFARQADIAHVRHACGFLKPGGRLTAIMSAEIQYRSDRSTAEFLKYARSLNAEIEPLPPGAFKASGTMISTCLLTLNRPA